MTDEITRLRIALRAMLEHYGPPERIADICEYPAGHPITLARQALSATPAPSAAAVVPDGYVLVPAEPTEAMLKAAIEDAGAWCEPYEAPRESGVAIDGDLSQEDADHINAEMMDALKSQYRAMIEAYTASRQEDPDNG